MAHTNYPHVTGRLDLFDELLVLTDMPNLHVHTHADSHTHTHTDTQTHTYMHADNCTRMQTDGLERVRRVGDSQLIQFHGASRRFKLHGLGHLTYAYHCRGCCCLPHGRTADSNRCTASDIQTCKIEQLSQNEHSKIFHVKSHKKMTDKGTDTLTH